MSKAARNAARAVQTHAKRHAKRTAMTVELAVVTTTSPLTVQLVQGGLKLGEDILLLSSAFRRHDRDFGVKIGDTAALVRQASGEYLVLDVQTSSEIMRGISTVALAGTTKNLAVSGGNAAMVTAHWLEVYDAAGDSIGFVPVFASKT